MKVQKSLKVLNKKIFWLIKLKPPARIYALIKITGGETCIGPYITPCHLWYYTIYVNNRWTVKLKTK